MAKHGTFKSIQRVVFNDEYGNEVHIFDAIDVDGNAWCMRIDSRSRAKESEWHKIEPLPKTNGDNETN